MRRDQVEVSLEEGETRGRCEWFKKEYVISIHDKVRVWRFIVRSDTPLMYIRNRRGPRMDP